MIALRAMSWIRSELDYMGVRCVCNTQGGVRLVSMEVGARGAALLTQT